MLSKLGRQSPRNGNHSDTIGPTDAAGAVNLTAGRIRRQRSLQVHHKSKLLRTSSTESVVTTMTIVMTQATPLFVRDLQSRTQNRTSS